jgi:hypothetical protein
MFAGGRGATFPPAFLWRGYMRTAIRQKKDLNTVNKRVNKKTITMTKNKIIELFSLLDAHGYSVYSFNQNTMNDSFKLIVIPK